MVQGSGAIAPKETASRSVFISYRRLDDDPPPDMPEAGGFVRYLHQQVRWELSQLGVPDAILWRDRNMIAPNDDWPEKILDELHRADLFLAIVSRNYVNSGWCKREGAVNFQVARLHDPGVTWRTADDAHQEENRLHDGLVGQATSSGRSWAQFDCRNPKG